MHRTRTRTRTSKHAHIPRCAPVRWRHLDHGGYQRLKHRCVGKLVQCRRRLLAKVHTADCKLGHPPGLRRERVPADGRDKVQHQPGREHIHLGAETAHGATRHINAGVRQRKVSATYTYSNPACPSIATIPRQRRRSRLAKPNLSRPSKHTSGATQPCAPGRADSIIDDCSASIDLLSPKSASFTTSSPCAPGPRRRNTFPGWTSLW